MQLACIAASPVKPLLTTFSPRSRTTIVDPRTRPLNLIAQLPGHLLSRRHFSTVFGVPPASVSRLPDAALILTSPSAPKRAHASTLLVNCFGTCSAADAHVSLYEGLCCRPAQPLHHNHGLKTRALRNDLRRLTRLCRFQGPAEKAHDIGQLRCGAWWCCNAGRLRRSSGTQG
jgi:hypothetical protein